MHRERKIDNTFFTCDVTCFEFEFNYIHSDRRTILRNVTSEEITRLKTIKITSRLFHKSTSLKLFLFIITGLFLRVLPDVLWSWMGKKCPAKIVFRTLCSDFQKISNLLYFHEILKMQYFVLLDFALISTLSVCAWHRTMQFITWAFFRGPLTVT